MKKLINRPEEIIKRELQGIAAARSDLVKVCIDPNYIIRVNAPVKGRVAIRWWHHCRIPSSPPSSS